MVSSLLEILATLAAGLVTGAALYITAVKRPAGVSCGSALAVTEFRPPRKKLDEVNRREAFGPGTPTGVLRCTDVDELGSAAWSTRVVTGWRRP